MDQEICHVIRDHVWRDGLGIDHYQVGFCLNRNIFKNIFIEINLLK